MDMGEYIRGLTYRVPESAQCLHPISRRIPSNDRGVQRADRYAGDPGRLNTHFRNPLVYTGLIRTQGSATLKHESDFIVPGQPERRWLLQLFALTRSHGYPLTA